MCENMDWKLIYQSRNWVEKVLRMKDPVAELDDIAAYCNDDQPAWMVTGQKFLEVIRDMILENGKFIMACQLTCRLSKPKLPRFLQIRPNPEITEGTFATLCRGDYISFANREI